MKKKLTKKDKARLKLRGYPLNDVAEDKQIRLGDDIDD